MKHSYEKQIQKASASRERFTSHFGEFIEKYGSQYMTDMYTAGFYPFPAQGDYGYIQCENSRHQKIYDAQDLFLEMDQARQDCLIPAGLVPKCPVCGGNMTMHLRCDQYFVEDENWHEAAGRYRDFLQKQSIKSWSCRNLALVLIPRGSSSIRSGR